MASYFIYFVLLTLTNIFAEYLNFLPWAEGLFFGRKLAFISSMYLVALQGSVCFKGNSVEIDRNTENSNQVPNSCEGGIQFAFLGVYFSVPFSRTRW
jgi:hypothetical protein